MSRSRIQDYLSLAAKIFIAGMALQFLLHTFFTYALKIPAILTPLRAWKEILIIGIAGILLYYITIDKDYRARLFTNKFFLTLLIVVGLSILISLATSLGIHHQGLFEFISSAKYNYTPLVIAVVGVMISFFLSKSHNESILNLAIQVIKGVVIFSFFRYLLLHTAPNALRLLGYTAPGLSIEWISGNPPPSVWLTEFYTGYIRNQGPFSGPLSLGFYLGALRPIFYSFVLYRKKFSDTRGRRALYIFVVISSFSRAARGMFIVASLIIALIVYRKHSKRIMICLTIALGAIILYIIGGGTSAIFLRTRSDQGHVEFFLRGLDMIQKNRLRGLGAASVGPGSNLVGAQEIFNPENQYMQIWLEYGVVGFITRLGSYIALAWKPLQEGLTSIITKTQYSLNQYSLSFIGIGAGIVALGIAGMVLHPFVDSSTIYPFMMISGILYGYHQQHNTLSNKQNSHTKSAPQLSTPLTTSNKKHISSIKRGQLLLKVRTIAIGLFFLIQTFLVYGSGTITTTLLLSSIRDGLFFVAAVGLCIWGWKYLFSFIRSYWFIVVPFVVLIGLNLGYLAQHIEDGLAVIAGIKYDIAYLIVFVVGMYGGYLAIKTKKTKQLQNYLQRFVVFIVASICVGVVRHSLKLITPNIFIHYLGYTTPSDFIPYTKPPIYYLTGSGGIQRLSGLFSGPNTFGFFLILCTSLLYMFVKSKRNKKTLILATIVYYLITLATLSRGALIGVSIQIFILMVYDHSIAGIKSLRESLKDLNTQQVIMGSIVIVLFGSGYMFINQRKVDSNAERTESQTSINQLVNQNIPLLGHSPGYVGPAQHYQEDYLEHQKNDYAMLENIYLQTLINQGRLGLGLLISIIGAIAYMHYSIAQYLYVQSYIPDDTKTIFLYTQYAGVGFFALLIIGGFLHIFIDSMVNYLFLLPYGASLAYAYYLSKNTENRKIDLSI